MLRKAFPRREAKLRRRRNRRLTCESLEQRIVLSGVPNWGTNLYENVDYASHGMWVNAGHTFRRWGNVDAPWQENSSLTFTDQGIPLQDAGAIGFLRGYGGGIYSLSYEGTGDVTFSHRARIIDGTLQTVDGVTKASVEVDDIPAGDPNELVYLHLRNVDPGDPVRNLRLIAPGYDVDSTQIFRDKFLKRLQPFSTLRFMDLNRTNSSEVDRWDERRSVDDFIQTSGPSDPSLGGVAWEHMISLANETGADAWITVPHLVAAEAVDDPAADDAGEIYIHELARLWRDNLNPDQTIIVEYSNEPWNSLFTQGQGDNWNYYNAVAPRIEKISDIFHEEFAGQEDRLEIVLSAQNANVFFATEGVRYFVDQGRNPSDVIDAIATAPYFGPGTSQEFTDLDSLFAAVDYHLDDARAHKELADLYGLKFYAYEGGKGFSPGATDIELIRQAQSDPRMAEAYREYAELWEELGGDLFMHFTHTGRGNAFWGLLEDTRELGSVKWDAVMGILLPAGDSSLDGVVGYEDFVTLRDNYATGMWWEQGDSDGDNDVDADDFKAMFHNLDFGALTVDQSNEIYVFAAAESIVVPPLDAPTVTIAATDDTATEELGDTAEFTFTRDNTSGPLTVSYSIGGTAESGDYLPTLDGTVTFADGSPTATLVITAVDDVEFDDGDTLELTLNIGTDYFVGGQGEAAITILDNEAFVYDGFDVAGGTLQGNESGWGWNSEWRVWLNDDANPEYQVVAEEGSIPHDELHTTGGYVTGNPQSGQKHAGRALDLSGRLAEYVNPDTGQLGADGTTLWLSTLVSKDTPAGSGGPMLRVSLTHDGPEQAWAYDIAMGYLRYQSDAGGVGYWSLQTPATSGLVTVRSDKPVVVDQPTLLVMRIDFGAESDLATLYIDPELGVVPSATGDAQMQVDDIDFKNLSFTTSRGAEDVGKLDEFRIGATFASVTPSAVPMVVVAADAGGPYEVDEGGAVALSGAGSTGPDPGALTYEWDLDGDGAFGETGAAAAQGDEVGVSPTFSATGLDGPSSVVVSLLVTDPQGNSDTATATIDVANAAPSLTVDSSAVSVPEGATAMNSGTLGDPGGDPLTLTASIGAIVDHGDGRWTWSQDAADGPDDSQAVTITATDDDGEETSVTFLLSVQNVAPEITSLASNVAVNGSSSGGVVTIDGSFFDPAGPLDVHTVTVDWGDGSVETVAAALIDQNNDTFTAEHTYVAGGIYTTAVTVEDEDGGVSATETVGAVIRGVALLDGTLYIIGTDARDVIKVNERAGGAEIRVDARLDVNASPPLRIRETYAAEDVQAIVIHTLGDDDDVNIAAGVSIGATAFAGAGDDLIRGGGGDDMLDGGEGDDRIYGSDGHDTIIDLSGDNRIWGDGGDDVVTTGDGDDQIRTQAGHDTILSSGGDNRIWSGPGDDVVTTGAGDDEIRTQAGDDLIDAGDGDNRIWSGAGDDVVTTGDGDDEIRSAAGDDMIDAGSGDSRVWSGAGDDVVTVGAGSDVVRAGSGRDIVIALAGVNELRGGQGDDILVGGADVDEVFGGQGDDLLLGGAGSDVLRGGAGDDLMIAGSTSNSGDVSLLEAALASWIDGDLTEALIDLGAILDDGDFDELLGNQGHDELIGSVEDDLRP